MLDYLEKHPKVLLTAGGVAAFLGAKDNLLGSSAPSSGQNGPPSGVIKRIIDRAMGRLGVPIMVTIGFLAFGILCRVLFEVRSLWRSKAIRLRTEETRAAAEIPCPQEETRRKAGA